MNNYLVIKIPTKSPNYIIKLLSNKKINIYYINYKKNYLYLKLKNKDESKLNKLLHYEINSTIGINNILTKIKNNLTLLIMILSFLLSVFIINNTIYKINIIHEDQTIRELLSKELSNQGIKPLTLKKDFQELNNIKEEILTKYKDNIEWLEIIPNGINYDIRVQERKNTPITTEYQNCNVVATKEALITNITSSQGEVIKDLQDIVKKDEIIISGNITLNEEIMNTVCATGVVYGETWYKINISIPKTIKVTEKTGKYRYNLVIENNNQTHTIFNSRLDKYTSSTKELLSIGDFKLLLKKEEEIINKEITHTDEDILKLIDIEVENKVKLLLKEDYEIIEKKVLKKTSNNSTIEVEMFLTIKEQIGEVIVVE